MNYDGYLGLAPIYNTQAPQKSNFLLQLKEQGKIDHLIVGIYMTNNAGNSSNIKFGGWDQSAITWGRFC